MHCWGLPRKLRHAEAVSHAAAQSSRPLGPKLKTHLLGHQLGHQLPPPVRLASSRVHSVRTSALLCSPGQASLPLTGWK